MFSMILSAAVIGVEAKAVQVEADVCDGLPMFCMVGDLSTEVREAADGYGRLCGIRESPFRQNG